MGAWMCCWILCISSLLTAHSLILTQSPGFKLVSVGASVELKCQFEQAFKYCFTAVTWQKLNLRTGELTTVDTIHENKVDQLGDRTCVLTLNNLKASAMYYCISQFNHMAMIGNGSRVIVTGHSEPKLSLVYTQEEERYDLQCLVSGLVPSQVRVFWMIGGTVVSGWTESGWTDHTESAAEFTRAHLSVPVEEWSRADDIQCVAVYDGKNISRTLMRTSCVTNFQNLSQFSQWFVFCGGGTVLLAVAVFFSVCLCQGKQRSGAAEISSVMFYPVDPTSLGLNLGPTKEMKGTTGQ
ncbi:uncharacterized protein LOC122323489 isoform X2 [Puntigrus tetrazona]|uniref:uncharacterized protein LOC122323489 isoform X2 n=1 Tax=Puntigrus tetrazona TaxID=1606681 RepID=UPI001C88E99A|nr:uncharacterized protein LOC122323489 isoform X2 [Puntigrus tetrazona]